MGNANSIEERGWNGDADFGEKAMSCVMELNLNIIYDNKLLTS